MNKAKVSKKIDKKIAKTIELIEYDWRWPKKFALEEEIIKGSFPDADVNVFHIGSTAVPGLSLQTHYRY